MGTITAKKRKNKNGCLIVSLTLILCTILGVVGWNTGVLLCKKILFPNQYEEYITKYAAENDLDKYLVMAVVKTESNFIPDAHSGKAEGLMQLTDETGRWVAEKLNINYDKVDLTDAKQNIQLGCYYLKYLITHYNNTDVALAAYNGGMGNVNKWLDNKKYSADGKTLSEIPFKETRDYVKKVNSSWERYRQMYGKEG